ncbi:MAG TPA: hypothetical protein VF768_00760, partial [Holophagaceae bacterium]
DRYLLGRVADSLLRIHEGKAEFREGGYEDHQAWVDLDLGEEDQAGSPPPEAPKKPEPKKSEPKPAEPASAKPRPVDKEKQKQLKRLERLAGEAEARVTELEAKLMALQAELAAMDPSDWQAFNARLDAQKALESELAYAMTDWEAAQGALEAAQG